MEVRKPPWMWTTYILQWRRPGLLVTALVSTRVESSHVSFHKNLKAMSGAGI